ncbi:MAG: dockerin type I domain-containing protein [Rubripirellula sp.]
MFRLNSKKLDHARIQLRRFESLEPRCLLAAAPFGTNLLQPLDVSRDGAVSALDALQVINALARSGDGTADPANNVGTFVDVNQDGAGTALDALQVINQLGRRSPTLAVTLPSDSAPKSDEASEAGLGLDLQTNDYTMAVNISVGELGDSSVNLRIGDQSAANHDITDLFDQGQALLTQERIDQFFGESLPDGDHVVRIEIPDSASDPIEFTLTVDREVPELIDVLPKRSVLVGDRTIEIQTATTGEDLFLDLQSISLVDAADPSRVLRPTGIAVSDRQPGFLVEFDEDIAAGNYEVVIDESRISTPAGNPVGDQIRRSPLAYLTPTAVWANAAGGRWSDAENWQSGEVPGENDVVLIDVPEGVVVVGPFGNLTTIEHLTLRGELQTSSNIQAKTISVDRGSLRITGGTAASDVLYTSRTGDGRIVIEDGAMRMDQGLVEVPIEIRTRGTLRISGGVEVNSTIHVAGDSTDFPATVRFEDAQQVTGRGVFELAGSQARTSRIVSTGEGFVDMADSLTIRSSRGSVAAAATNPINLRAKLVDDGRPSDDVGEREIAISGLGSDNGSLELNLQTPAGLVKIDSLTDQTIRNRGTAPLEFKSSALLTRVVIDSPTLVTDKLRLSENVTLNDVVSIEGAADNLARISLEGSVSVDGNGEIVFAGTATGPQDQRIEAIKVSSQSSPQVAVLGPQITIRGNTGTVFGYAGIGVDVLGTVIGDADSNIVLRGIESTAGFQIDSPAGTVTIDDPTPNLKVTGIGESFIRITDNQRWLAPDLSIDVNVEAGGSLELTGSTTYGSTTIDGTITLLGNDSDRAELLLDGTEPVAGDGEIVFAGQTTTPYGNLFKADLRGKALDSRIAVRGRNGLFGGSVTYTGSVTATDEGVIAIGKLLGAGNAITIDSRDGTVIVGELENIVIDGVQDSGVVIHPYADLGFPGDGFDLGTLGFDRLANVTLNLPARMLGGGIVIADSLKLNSTMTLIGDLDTPVRGDLEPRNSNIQFADGDDNAVELTGTGSILFGPSIETPNLDGHSISGANTSSLNIGSGITLGGQSGRFTNMVHAGPIVSEAGAIIELLRYTTSPGRIDLTPQAGQLFLRSVDSELDSIVIDGTDGSVLYTASLGLKNPTINIPLLVQNMPGEDFRLGLVVDGNLQLNSTLTLVDQSTFLTLTDDDRPSDEKHSRLFGTGTLVLAQFDPNPDDDIAVSGHSVGSANSLTVESGITIRAGKGSISSGGELRIRGTVIDLHGQLNIVDAVEE